MHGGEETLTHWRACASPLFLSVLPLPPLVCCVRSEPLLCVPGLRDLHLPVCGGQRPGPRTGSHQGPLWSDCQYPRGVGCPGGWPWVRLTHAVPWACKVSWVVPPSAPPLPRSIAALSCLVLPCPSSVDFKFFYELRHAEREWRESGGLGGGQHRDIFFTFVAFLIFHF